MSITDKIKQEITDKIKQALTDAMTDGALGAADIESLSDRIKLEVPKDKSHGDFACSAAMALAREFRCAPAKIAAEITSRIDKGANIEKIEVAGAGFINFYLTPDWLYETMRAIEEQGADYGKIDIGKGKKAMVEFVSANPTGPMHMGNARGGALGDCLASVLEYAGYDVTREFYINDAGNQIDKFGRSLSARYIQQLRGEDAVEFPEDGYQGSDIIDRAKEFIEIKGDKYLDAPEEERAQALIDYALEKNIAALKTDLEKYRIHYDVWFRESELHKSGAVKAAIDRLSERGYTYEQDGALWLDCEKMGLEKNEVLIRQNGIPTYFAADIAYHINKLETRGFDRAINVWGADHHGHVARMKEALSAVGIDSNRLDIVLMQLVRLTRDGEVVRMSKRTGKAISLTDLLDEVSIDAARFFFNMRGAGSHLDFDLELAKEQSNDNPVFYVQYAHARICGILRILKEDGVVPKAYAEINPSLLTHESELSLLKKLADMPEEIRISAETLEPARMTRYATELATEFHGFYNNCRVNVDDEKLRDARVKLIDCARKVIAGVLNMLKIDAPAHM